MTAKINWDHFRDLFPIIGRVTERQVRRVEALKKLHQTRREEDESEQLRKMSPREKLDTLIRLEEMR